MFFFGQGVFYARKLSRLTQTFVIIFVLTISCEIVEKTDRGQFGESFNSSNCLPGGKGRANLWTGSEATSICLQDLVCLRWMVWSTGWEVAFFGWCSRSPYNTSLLQNTIYITSYNHQKYANIVLLYMQPVLRDAWDSVCENTCIMPTVSFACWIFELFWFD